MKRIVLFLLLSIALLGCRSSVATGDLTITLTADPSPAMVGDASLIITLRDKADNAIENATVRVKGDMTDDAVEPVLGEVVGGNYGVYSVPFAWPMAGDWVVTVEVESADGTRQEQTFDLSVTGTS